MSKRDRQPLWTPNFGLLALLNLGASMVFVTLMTYMALYAAQRFNAHDAAAGFAASAFILAASVIRLAVGKYLDFVGRRHLLLIALCVYLVCTLLYPLAPSYGWMIVIRLVHGAAFGCISTAATASVIGLIPRSRRAEGMGFFAMTATIPTALGPLTAVLLSVHVHPNAVFYFTSVFAVVSLVALFFVQIPERAPTEEERRRKWSLRLSDLADRRALPVAGVVLLCGVGYSVIVTYLAPYLVGRGMVEGASLFFLVYALGMLLVRAVAGRIQDKRGDNAVVPALIVVFAVALAGLSLADQLWQVLAVALLAGIGFGGVVPSLQVVGVTRAAPHRVAIATTTHYMMLDGSLAVGPVLLGAFIPQLGYQGLFLVAAGIVVCALGLYWLVHGRRTRQRG